jgi:HK97 family phage prohead protease
MKTKIRCVKSKLEDLTNDGSYIAYASVFGNTDSDGDIIEKGAFKKTLKKTKGFIPLVWFHDPRRPVGAAAGEEDEKGLLIKGQLNLEIQDGQEVYSNMKAGIVGDHSFAFDILKSEPILDDDKNMTGRSIKEVKLYEASPLTNGFAANDQAGLIALKWRKGHEADSEKMTYEEMLEAQIWVGIYLKKEFGPELKTVVAFQDLPLADRDRRWDASGARARIRQAAEGADGEVDFSKYRRGFLWFDSENADTLGAYKLPIADILGDRLTAVPRGIFAAAAATLGARGGVDIPPGDLKTVQNHLERYYRKMDLESPFKERSSIEIHNIVELDGEKIAEIVDSVNPSNVDSVDEAKAMQSFYDSMKLFESVITNSSL